MERKDAEDIMKSIKKINEGLNDVAVISEGIEDKNERISFRTDLGDLISDVYSKLMLPVIRKYPDLDPDI